MSWDVPDAAEMVITNTSDADVDIGSRFLPEGLLDFRTKGPAGVPVKTEPYRYSLTPYSPTHEPYILKPGESYRIYAGLLRTVPAEKRVAGTYKVKAVYTVKGKEYTSAEVEVKWPGNKE